MAKISSVKLDLDGDIIPEKYNSDKYKEIRTGTEHCICQKDCSEIVAIKCKFTNQWCDKEEVKYFCEPCIYIKALARPTDTQQKIKNIMDAMKDLLLYKNQKYGDSAINPKKIFYKGDSTNSILIRLDDKLGRVMSNTEEKPRINDVADIIGYCTLLLISIGVTAEDIAKFKD